MSTKKIAILVADDHHLIRGSLVRAFKTVPDMAVVGEAATFKETLVRIGELSPDVVLLDVGMPGRGPTEMIESAVKNHPLSRILILTAQPEDAYAVALLRAGAAGFLRKTRPFEEMVAAIRQVVAGGRHISGTLTEILLEGRAGATGREGWDSLSERERQVCIFLAAGVSPTRIGEQMDLSVKTISTYRIRALEKLGLANNSELVRFALREGLLDQPPV